MEDVNPRPVTYNTFWTLFISSEVSLSAVAGLIRDFSSRRSLKSKSVMIFMVFTTIFILAWPTMISAMTGYDTNNMPYVTIAVGEHMLFHYFDPVLYVIHDGSRLSGLTDEYKVPYCSFTSHSKYYTSRLSGLEFPTSVLSKRNSSTDKICFYKAEPPVARSKLQTGYACSYDDELQMQVSKCQ